MCQLLICSQILLGKVSDFLNLTIIKIINGEMPIGMGGSFNLCDVRDLAAGCIAAADKGRKGECYILGNEEVTLKKMCKYSGQKISLKHYK